MIRSTQASSSSPITRVVSSQRCGTAEGDQAVGEHLAVGGAPLVELEGDLVLAVDGAVEVLQAGEVHVARLVVLVARRRPHTHADSLARAGAWLRRWCRRK